MLLRRLRGNAECTVNRAGESYHDVMNSRRVPMTSHTSYLIVQVGYEFVTSWIGEDTRFAFTYPPSSLWVEYRWSLVKMTWRSEYVIELVTSVDEVWVLLQLTETWVSSVPKCVRTYTFPLLLDLTDFLCIE